MTVSPALRCAPVAPRAGAVPLLHGPMLPWAALFANVLTFFGLPILIPIPGPLGQLMAQGALPLALLLALLANPGAVIRPNLFLGLLTVMAVAAAAVSIHNEFLFGSAFRAGRLLVFVLVLWLLSPWWGRDDLILLRAHLRVLAVLLASVLLGALLAPGKAFSYEGRLSGALWPIPPTQVAHYSAVLLGCVVVLWFCGLVRGGTAGLTLLAGGGALIATHTRTALAALLFGLLLAGASLFLGHARVRRTAGAVVLLGGFVGGFFAPLITQWLSRGQSAQEATQLTGRTKVWTAIFDLDRPGPARLFGSGLSNKSYGGLPIDSNWVATYLELGWCGMGIAVALLLLPALIAVTRPRGPRRAVALFLVGYCAVASFTETGLGDASPYLLDLVVAASLLATPARRAPA